MSFKNLGTVVQAVKLLPRTSGEIQQNLHVLSNLLKGVSEDALLSAASFLKLDGGQIACMLSAKGMTNAQIASKLATTGLSKEAAIAALKFMGLKTAGIDAAIANITFAESSGVATTGLAALGAALKSVITGLWTFLTTNPVGWAISAAAAIGAVVLVVDALTVSFEEAQEAAAESKQAYEDTVSEVESLNSELETTKKRIEELEALGDGISVVEQDELDNLRETNEQLEAQLKIKQKLAEFDLKQAKEDAARVLTTTVEMEFAGVATDTYGNIIYTYDSLDIIDVAKKRQDELNELQRQLNELQDTQADLADQENTDEQLFRNNQNKIAALQSQIDALDKEITNSAQVINDAYITLTDDAAKMSESDALLAKEALDFLTSLGYYAEDAAIQTDKALAKIAENFTATLENGDFNNKNLRKHYFDRWLEGLSDEDRKIVYEIYCDTDTAQYNLYDWQNAVSDYKRAALEANEEIANEATEAANNAEAVIASISAAKEALYSQKTGTSISKEAFESEELADYTSALEYNNGVLQLNTEKVNELVKAKAEEQIAHNDAAKALMQSEYLEKAAEIEKLRKKIADKTFEEGESAETVRAHIDELLDANKALKSQCTSYDLLNASLREATSAYQHWINAQNASESGDMFDDALNAMHHINETLNNIESEFYGRVNREDYKAALDFIIPDGIDRNDQAAIDEYLKSVNDYFTFDDDGKYTGLNMAKFFEDAKEAGLMIFDEASSSYYIAGEKSMEEFAEGLDIALPLVQAIFGELQEFANINWSDEASKSISDLAVEANEAAESLRSLGRVGDTEINLDLSGFEKAEDKIGALEDAIDRANKIKAEPNVDPSEIEYANDILRYCITQKQLLSRPDIMMVDTSLVKGKIGDVISLLVDYQNAKNELDLNNALNIDTTQAQQNLDNAVEAIRNIDANTLMSIGIDTTSLESIDDFISDLNQERLEKLGVKAEAIIGGIEESISNLNQTIVMNVDSREHDRFIKGLKDQHVNIYYHAIEVDNSTTNKGTNTKDGIGGSNGRTSATYFGESSGLAMAGGNYRRTVGGKTLLGELGEEIVVDTKTGRWYTVGTNGAEFRDIPKDAIVFNHEQTESLLKKGYVASRASALVNGTALASGNAMVSGGGWSSSIIDRYSSSEIGNTYGNTVNEHDVTDELEIFDWIEVAINRIEQAIERLATAANNTYNSLKTRLGAAYDEITLVNRELSIQQKAYDRYMQEANAVGLSSDLALKVQHGTVDLAEYDENTQKLIQDYQELYEKSIACDGAIQQLHEDLASLYEDNFNNIQEDFDNQLELLEHMTATYENGIDMLETQGYLKSTDYYAALQDLEKQNIAILKSELASLEQAFSEAMNSGEIEEESEAFYSMVSAINDVKERIDEAQLSLEEYAKTMREIEWEHFDYTQDRISQITKESDFMIDLMSNANMYTDDGKLTDDGLATMGLHGLNYNTYMAQSDAYAQEILAINEQLANDPNNTQLIERREELLGLQQDSILAAEAEKQAMIDLVREGIELELDAMQELIDAYTTALDSAKDLHDYQRRVKDHTSEISSIQKQLSAYENDFTEETQAKVQQLKVQLEKAEDDLAETEYDKYISESKKLLDSLYADYEALLNERLDNSEALLEEMIGKINDNADSINSTLTEVADNVGYTMTESMQSIWNGSTEALNGIISVYGDDFGEKMTAANNVLSQIEANTAAMIVASDEQAEDVVDNTSSQTVPDQSTTTPTAPTTPNTPEPSTPQTSAVQEKSITIGGKIDAKGAKIYSYAGDNSGDTQYYAQDPIYIVLKEENGYIQVRHHKLSSGVTGWFKKSDVKAYKTGGLVDYTGLAQLDGTPSKPELVLNAQDTANFIALKETLQRMAEQGLTFGTTTSGIHAQQFSGIADISKKIAGLRDSSGVNTGVNVGDTQVTIEIDHVDDYNDFVNKLRADKKFEEMIQDMTVGRMLGGSRLSKNKYTW